MELTFKTAHADLYREGDQLFVHLVGVDLAELNAAVVKFQEEQAAPVAQAPAEPAPEAPAVPESPEV